MTLRTGALAVALAMLVQVALSAGDVNPSKKADSKARNKAPAFTLSSVETNVLNKTNAERAKYGLPPLIVDQKLEVSARTHTAWMTRNETLEHTSQGIGENIAMGQQDSNEVLEAWMNSSGHRANILNSDYRRIGVAAYRTPAGTIYWCQQFEP